MARPQTRTQQHMTHQAHLRTEDPYTSPEVGMMMFDYVVYSAIVHALDELDMREYGVNNGIADRAHQARIDRTDDHVDLVNVQLQIFKGMHPGLEPPAETMYRLEFVKFVMLYARRVVVDYDCSGNPEVKFCNPASVAKQPAASLRDRRLQNRARAQRWLQLRGEDSQTNQYSRFDALTKELRNSQHVIEDLTLLDLVPSFIRLARSLQDLEEGRVASQQWLELACEMMFQGAVEQAALNDHYYGDPRLHDVVTEAFAWGPLPIPDAPVEGDDPYDDAEAVLHDIFYIAPVEPVEFSSLDTTDSDNELTAEPWRKLRRHAINKLMRAAPSKKRSHDGEPRTDTIAALRAMVRQRGHTQRAFDTHLRQLLRGMLDIEHHLPLLAQLERAAFRLPGEHMPQIFIDGEPISPSVANRILRHYMENIHPRVM